MITKVRVKNFKCFGESGGDFELAPLTFLFGDNSAGKSTVLQALDYCLGDSRKSVADGLASLSSELHPETSREFKQLVFKNDESRSMEIEISCSLPDGAALTALTAVPPLTGPTDETDKLNRIRASIERYNHTLAPRPHIESSSSSLEKLSSRYVEDPLVVKEINELLRRLDVGYEYISSDTVRDTVFDLELPVEHVGTGIACLMDNLEQLASLSPNSILALEEPEVHLHPRQLGPLTEILVQRVQHVEGSQAIVECHSQHMVLKIMNLILKGRIRPNDVRILYVQRREEGSVVVPISIKTNGDLSGWPGGFFPELGDLIAEGLT